MVAMMCMVVVVVVVVVGIFGQSRRLPCQCPDRAPDQDQVRDRDRDQGQDPLAGVAVAPPSPPSIPSRNRPAREKRRNPRLQKFKTGEGKRGSELREILFVCETKRTDDLRE